MATPRECYEPENKWKCTELERERMSDDLMKLNDTELNYINFDDETDSDNASYDSDEDFVLQKSLFYFKQFSIVRTSEAFSIRDILPWKTHFVFPNVKFLCFFLTETFVLYLCNFNIAKNVNIAGIAFLQKFITKFPVYKVFQNVVFVSKSFFS